MQCEGCGNMDMQHNRRDESGNRECSSWPRCTRCGDACKADASDTSGSWKAIRLDLGLCDQCAIWEEHARAYEKNPGRTLIINGFSYGPDASNTVALGAPDPHPGAQFRGMAGRRFDFERFDGSPPQSCYSLWSGGKISADVRHRMPDNARFLNGAGTFTVGETSGFNASR